VATKKHLEENNIVFLVADLTEDNPEANKLLEALGNKGHTLPFVAVFPAGDPNRPILMDGLITQKQVLTALRDAGPSQVTGGTATAMRPGAERN
jgi:thiol:disulfide interchange protein